MFTQDKDINGCKKRLIQQICLLFMSLMMLEAITKIN